MTSEIPSQNFGAHSCCLYHKEHTELSTKFFLKFLLNIPHCTANPSLFQMPFSFIIYSDSDAKLVWYLQNICITLNLSCQEKLNGYILKRFYKHAMPQ